MKKTSIILLSVVAIILLSIGWFISASNSIVQKEEAVKGAWSQVENVYQRRLDLIPNLVNTVKGYAKHEQETLEKVIQARNQAINGKNNSFADFKKSQDNLSGALGRLMVLVEKYPDLKANENFRDLQSQLEGSENRITVERKRFNDIVQEYNSYIKLFPTSVVASMKGVTPRPYFEAQAGAATAPKVEF